MMGFSLSRGIGILSLLILGGGVLLSNGAEETSGDTITLHYYDSELTDGLTALVEMFESVRPGTNIELELALDGSNDLLPERFRRVESVPEIVQLHPYREVYEYADNGWLEDLTETSAVSPMIELVRDSVVLEERLYALPVDLNGVGVLYNIDIFAQHQLNPPAVLSDLEAVVSRLNEEGIIPFSGLSGIDCSTGQFATMVHTSLAENLFDPWFKSMNQGSGSYVDPARPTDLFALIDFVKENSRPNSANLDWQEQLELFATGGVAMMIQRVEIYSEAVEQYPDLNCGFFPFPVNDRPNYTKPSAGANSALAVSSMATSRAKKLALEFLEWLSTPEAIDIMIDRCNLLPPFASLDYSKLAMPIREFVDYARKGETNPWVALHYPSGVYRKICELSTKYLLGELSREEMIQQIDSEWRASMER